MPGHKRRTPEPQLTFAFRTGEILSIELTDGNSDCALGVNVAVLALSAAAKAVGHKDFQEWAPPLQVQLCRLVGLHPDWIREIDAFAAKLGHYRNQNPQMPPDVDDEANHAPE